jgi:nucleotide-binding universal stress UspA family protein
MKILIGYDGSNSAEAAIADLRRAALPGDTEAIVLTVADVWPGLLAGNSDPLPPGSRVAIEEFAQHARARAEDAMAEATSLAAQGSERVRSLFPSWNVRPKAVADSPYWGIIRCADELAADFVVVGSHSRSTIHQAVLGSVPLNVLHHAACSVRIGRGDPGDAAGPVRLIIGVDASVGSAAAVSSVAARRWPAGSQLRVVTATDDRLLVLMLEAVSHRNVEARYRLPRPAKDAKDAAERLVVMAADQLRPTGLSISTAVGDGDPKRVLLREAEEWAADCIVVGAQGLTRLKRLLIGSVSSSVAARAGCSVEVIRPVEP